LYNNEIILKNTSTTIRLKNIENGNYIYILYRDSLGINEIQRNATGNFNTGTLNSTNIYFVKKIKGNCMSSLTKVIVTVVDNSTIYVPTIFTPNGDGTNDILEIKVFGQIRIDNFAIYNRFGQKVFDTKSHLIGWDGSFKNKIVDVGVYVWFLNAYDVFNNKKIFQKGTVTLAR
jgi:gliding motility-associated-like protein